MTKKSFEIYPIDLQLNACLSMQVQFEYNRLDEAISRVPLALVNQKKIERNKQFVSCVDLISYQIGWGKLLLSWYAKGIKGEKVEMPGEGFASWKYTEIASHFYRKYPLDSGRQQRELFHNTVLQILQITEKEDQNGHLDQTGLWNWCRLQSGKEWPLEKWIKVNTISPYKRARAELKKMLRNQ